MAGISTFTGAPTIPPGSESSTKVAVTGKVFYKITADGKVLDPTGCLVFSDVTAFKVHLVVTLFIQDTEDGPVRKEKRGFVTFLNASALNERLDIQLVSAQQEGFILPPEGTYQGSLDTLIYLAEGSTLTVCVPKLTSGTLRDIRATADVGEFYTREDPDVQAMCAAFDSIPRKNSEWTIDFFPAERELIQSTIIPRLLLVRDLLADLYRRSIHLGKEIKFSGKTETRLLCFPVTRETRGFSASAKVLPDGTFAYHIYPQVIAGTSKKASIKIVSVEDPSRFCLAVKISPNKGVRVERYLTRISHEWDLQESFSHPYIGKPLRRFSYPSTTPESKGNESCGGAGSVIEPSTLEIAKVYMEAGIELFIMLRVFWKDWMKNATSPEECLHLIDQLKSIVIQTAIGIAYLHSKGFIHLDIKSENIIVQIQYDERGRLIFTIKLIDFGYTKHVDDVDQLRDRQRGSEYHLADGTTMANFLRGAFIAKERDLYAFGLVCRDIGELNTLLEFSPLIAESDQKALWAVLADFNAFLVSIQIPLCTTETRAEDVFYTPRWDLKQVITELSGYDLLANYTKHKEAT